MKVRKPNFDYATSLPHWCKSNPGFSQLQNLGSLMLPYLEPYLNTVMRRAQVKLDPEHPLNADIALFCKQEAMHYLQHGAYNEKLREAGYARLPEIEKRYEDHFQRLLDQKSLKYNCAYCLGFETIGPVATAMWFEGLDDFLEGADPAVVGLWKWHLAEEYEHRTVAFDVYQTLFGGYFYRVYGLYAFMRDWRAFNREFLKYLLTEDGKKMSADEIALSREQLAAFKKRQSRFSLPRLLRTLSPFYNPRKLTPPKGVPELLRKIADAA